MTIGLQQFITRDFCSGVSLVNTVRCSTPLANSSSPIRSICRPKNALPGSSPTSRQILQVITHRVVTSQHFYRYAVFLQRSDRLLRTFFRRVEEGQQPLDHHIALVSYAQQRNLLLIAQFPASQ